MKTLRPLVFWPPFISMMVVVVLSFTAPTSFLAVATKLNNWILEHLGWLFSGTSLWMVVLCIWVMFSRFGQLRIGGEDAEPLLTRWQWFSILLCSTVAIGILFWATAEPLYHLRKPPVSLGILAQTPHAAQFAMSTMYLHWTFTPYAIYTIPALVFAFAFYNQKQAFSLRSIVLPLFSKEPPAWLGPAIDALCLFALVAGMAASLGTGVLTITGGFGHFLAWKTTPWLLGIVTAVIVVTFCISATSGLMKGIRLLSDLNAKIFIGLGLFVFVFGPTTFLLRFGLEGIGQYLGTFFQRSLFVGAMPADPWPQSWSVFYWANWMAWAPVTAMFLGRIAKGYTIREFVIFNWILPSLFSMAWMAIFSGTTLHMELIQKLNILGILSQKGPNIVVYSIFANLPLASILIVLFLFTSVLSYVTAADSNTTAMAALSSQGISSEQAEPPMFPKIAWGLTVGLVAWIMVSFAGVKGIKMISNLGGLPALFLLIAVNFALLRLLLKYR